MILRKFWVTLAIRKEAFGFGDASAKAAFVWADAY